MMDFLIDILNIIIIYYLIGVMVYNLFGIDIVIEPLFDISYKIQKKKFNNK